MAHTVGSWLKSAREGRGISLNEISQATKMNLLFLQAIENDRFEQLPGGMFPRAMARAYARAMGASEDDIVDIYSQQFPPPPPPPEPPQKNRKPLLRFTAMFGFFLLVAASGLAYLRIDRASGLSSGASQPVAQPIPEAAVPELPQSSFVASAAPLVTQSPHAGNGLDLQILALDECWLSLSADGTVVEKRLLKKGDAFNYHADISFEAVVGNAGGVKIVINGKVWENLGDPNDVKKIRIDNTEGKVRLTT